MADGCNHVRMKVQRPWLKELQSYKGESNLPVVLSSTTKTGFTVE